MTHIAAIVLILGLCLPQALIAGEVLKAGEIDSSKVEVGAYMDRLKEITDTLSVKKENNPVNCRQVIRRCSWRGSFRPCGRRSRRENETFCPLGHGLAITSATRSELI